MWRGRCEKMSFEQKTEHLVAVGGLRGWWVFMSDDEINSSLHSIFNTTQTHTRTRNKPHPPFPPLLLDRFMSPRGGRKG